MGSRYRTGESKLIFYVGTDTFLCRSRLNSQRRLWRQPDRFYIRNPGTEKPLVFTQGWFFNLKNRREDLFSPVHWWKSDYLTSLITHPNLYEGFFHRLRQPSREQLEGRRRWALYLHYWPRRRRWDVHTPPELTPVTRTRFMWFCLCVLLYSCNYSTIVMV